MLHSFPDCVMRPVSARFAKVIGLCAVALLAGASSVFAQAQQTLRVAPLVKEDQVPSRSSSPTV